MSDDVRESVLSARSLSEQDAYMAGQRQALQLAREKGVDYAEGIIRASQSTILANREAR